ncbi:Nad dependent epimerase dehydratase [Neofusicoccum parvum]|uniref:Nad dependent epimerase dehydratase n=1 Tax=Neofusicoccum parvum TaxID=310453 RepID=A0ACB5S0T1_9PEZI|nr:Nad dependent epimerase dehydratase [Neofusicoccum parvum]
MSTTNPPLPTKRTHPMGVLVLGQSRTGTSSMRAALQHLGYTRVFHFFSLFENPLQTPVWERAFRAKFAGSGAAFGRADWDALLGADCTAVTDTPCHIFAEELVAAYPEAKVVLTVRDGVDAWFDSYSSTIWPFLRDEQVAPAWWWRVVMLLRPGMPFAYLDVMHRCMTRFTSLGAIPTEGKKYYVERYEAVRRLVEGEEGRLLVFNVKEGWGPLCRHLGVEVPEGVPFPRRFDGDEFQEMWRQWKRDSVLGAAWNVGKWLAVVLAVVGGWRYCLRGRV